MKTSVALFFLLFYCSLLAQEKGVSPISAAEDSGNSTTYAVVVGISDYQDERIPDLRFSDKDAEAFANFLRSPAGGSLDADHLKLLTNEQATAGQVGAELFWLLDEVKEGDNAIIYFSGHGDVERETVSQPGYLLCADAPSRVYIGGGALALPMFQDIISTLSIENKAKVIVITDACRSGKLAGSKVGGSQITGANLAQKTANEIKILSCQPEEYSIEGEQWGGGRGAFSYHLIDGMYGMADNNEDLSVNLMEIGRYLEDHVTMEVSPQSQIPMVIGGRSEKLTTVFPELLDKLRNEKQGQLALFTPTESKGIEDEILAKVDTSVRKMYRLFKRSLKDRVFLEPVDACADVYYNQLMQESKLSRLHGSMTRNYAAALQDDAQQVLNKWLMIDSRELTTSKFNQEQKYSSYPYYLERAAALLGPDHYMYPILKARKLYFEGYLLHIDSRHADRELGEKALAKYREALKWQPESPHIFCSMMLTHFYQMLEPDSAEYYAHKATELAPAWLLPYSWLAFLYHDWTSLRDFDKTRFFLELADQIDTTAADSNAWHINTWAAHFMDIGQFLEAESMYKKMIGLDSMIAWAYGNLGLLYSNSGKLAEAIPMYRKAIELDPTGWTGWVQLGIAYMELNSYKEAEESLKKAHLLDSTSLWPPMQLGCVYILTGRHEEAEEYIKGVFARDSMFTAGYSNLGGAYITIKQYGKAERYLKKAVQLDSISSVHRYRLGLVYMNTNQLVEAEQQFLKVLSLDSTSSYAHPNLGLVYAKMGRYSEAGSLFKKGLELDPDNEKNISVNYAVLYSLQGQPDKAFDYLEKSFQLGYKKDDTHIDLMEEPGLAPLRERKERWQELIQKYFPDGDNE